MGAAARPGRGRVPRGGPVHARLRADRDPGHLAAQALAGAGGVELDLRVCRLDQATPFRGGRALRLFHQFVGTVLRVVDDLRGAFTRLAHDVVRLAARLGQGFLALLGGGKTLRDLLAPLRAKYFISGELNTNVGDMTAIEHRLAALKAKYSSGHTYELDGFSAEFPDWHFNVRPSNTEPLLRLNLEAKTPQLMEQKRDEVLAIIRAGGVKGTGH